MSYILCKHSDVKLDLAVKKKYWPKLTSVFQRTGCKYESETEYKIKNEQWIKLGDIRSEKGYEIGALISLFYALEFDSLAENKGKEDKFYILINPVRKEKKHVRKDRKEVSAGRKGGNSGEPAGIAESGQNI